ncbi:MAG: hypothetical protein JSR53_04290, partial [Proteobacteria bacterium]|nr:hypothetical protein [Pseudomonadota bacterium]
DLGNGSWVTKNADGTATYQDNSGGYFNFDKNSNPSHVGRNAQGLLSQWNKTYVTDTYAPGGAQQRTDPAATGFTLNANGTVTRKGTNPDVKPNEMYGDYTTRNSINNVKNAEARAYYQANPDAFLTTEATGQDPDTFFIRYFYNTNYGRPAGEWGGPGASSLNNGGNTAGGSGGSALGGPGAGATVGGGSSGSSGGTGSGTSSGRDVNYGTDTIEGRVYGLMATDRYGNYTNPVLQQAADNAMKSFASRGLLNSSMAQQAAYQAALGEAIKIAGPDAQTYFSQGRANQDASNVFKRDENQYKEDRWKIDQQLSLEREKMAQNMGQFNQELAYKYDALKLDKDTRAEAEARAQKYALEIKNIDAVNGAYDLYLRRIQDIDMNKDLSGPNKIEMKNQAGKDFDLYAKAKGIAWEMGLGSRFAASTADAKVQESVQGGMLSSAGGGGS